MPCRMQRPLYGLLLLLGPAACGDDVTASETAGSSNTAPVGSSSSTSSTGETTSSTDTGVPAGPQCGNGFVEADEDCDDGNTVANDGCSKLCLDEFCGDGIVQTGEACDLGSDNNDNKPCTTACRENICGDGLRGPSETCDDGNTNDDDGCGADCTLESCGNGELEAGESCDDGNRDQDDACTTLCTPPVCGDGLLSASQGENCDDGNPDNTDACPNDCTEAVCGDGITEGGEACDEAELNGDGTSLCSPECTLNVCGDGYLVPALEACDAGEATGDGISECGPTCSLNVCGDAYHHLATEGCDAGERNGFVPCSTGCAAVPEVVQIAFSGSSVCARYADGAVRCWGSSHAGALGLDPPTAENFIGNDPGEMPPHPADLGGPVVDIAAGPSPDCYCASRPDGAVLCWGSGLSPTVWEDNEYGTQRYDGNLGPREARFSSEWEESEYYVGDLPGEMPPEPIPLGGGASTRLSLGYTSVCSVMDDGTLRCWGRADHEWPALGYGAQFVRAFPEHFPPPPVNLGVSAVEVAHTYRRTCVLGTDQFVRCFGKAEYGWLGDGDAGLPPSGDNIAPPPVVNLGTPVTQITDGDESMCALGTDGSVRCFGGYVTGYGAPAEVIGDDLDDMPPVPIDLGPTTTKKLVSVNQVCALSTDGEVRCWGGFPTTYGYGIANHIIGDEPGEMPPPPIDLGGTAIDIFGSKRQTSVCAILDDHSVTCWGNWIAGLGSGVIGFDTIGDEPSELPPPSMRLYD